MNTPSWNPKKLPESSAISHICGQLSSDKPCECLAANPLVQFQEWLDIQLNLLLADNRAWETSQSNRTYFGRGSK